VYELSNKTSLDTDYLNDILDFCTPPIKERFLVVIKWGSNFNGTAFLKGDKRIKTDPRTPCCRLVLPEWRYKNKIWKKPVKFCGEEDYLGVTVNNFEEGLIYLASHETRHVWQYYNPKETKMYGAKTLYSETDADAYAVMKIQEWTSNDTKSNA